MKREAVVAMAIDSKRSCKWIQRERCCLPFFLIVHKYYEYVALHPCCVTSMPCGHNVVAKQRTCG